MTVRNKKVEIDTIKIKGISASSVFLFGDTETITSSAYFDTPSDSLLITPKVPIRSKEKNRNQSLS
ncbi:spore gernimation protein GerPD [Paenibacillus sp. SI8]|uniref:spore gernimation protein GerPD n=1 Tax=unclassified Paenibacillus TaxID=185978 RepID=UPI00346745DC